MKLVKGPCFNNVLIIKANEMRCFSTLFW